MVVEPSVTVTGPPAFIEGMHPPQPDEVHRSPLMPTWIQEIYSVLTTHTVQLKTQASQMEQIQDLIKKNQELQLALDKAHQKIAQLESAANHTSPPASDNDPILKRSSAGTSASHWADLAAKPPTCQNYGLPTQGSISYQTCT